MKVLDLFSGLGGFSQAFKDRGHFVTTVDIESKFKPDVCIDVIEYEPDIQYDVILASPPCTEFSKSSMPKSWKCNENGCYPDTALLERAIAIIKKNKPVYWVVENVAGARKYFNFLLGKPVKKVGSRYLWGVFPVFDCEDVYGKWLLSPHADRAAMRSLIPYSLSISLCIMCEVGLEEQLKQVKIPCYSKLQGEKR